MNDFLQLILKEFQHLTVEFKTPLENPILIFSLVLTIILLSPILLQKIKIPGIIGLIISGVVIGPFGLNILEKSSAVELFSTIGLLYIMFIAGLELDLNEFKKHRNKSFLFGFFTFVTPLAVGFPACYYLLGYDFNASFLTASMFATHTLVTYPIVSKFGVTKNQAVAITVGGTILTDTAVLIILAVIMGNAQGSLNQTFWIKLGISLLLFTFIMFFIIPRIAKWFFRKLESEKHSHYIFVLSVVFFSAFLAHIAGVEPIIGAFVAGLSLNSLIPHSSALMNRIDFIGNSIFIPFFLISVGMLVDVRVLFNGPTAIIIAGVLSTVAIFSKYIAAFFTQKSFKYSPPQRQLIFGLSGAHAAATLAVVLVGYQAKILDENILNGTIILILITCIVASFATEKAAKKIALSMDDEDVTDDAPWLNNEHILIPVIDLQSIEKVLEFSILLKDNKSVNPITLLSVVPNDSEAEANIIKAKRKVETITKEAIASETKLNFINTIDHNPASGVARTSREIMASIIVMNWINRSGFIDKIIGDNTNSVITNTDKMLFLVNLRQSLVVQKRIVVIVPPAAEAEQGFHHWLKKIALIGQELSIPVAFFGEEKSIEAIKKTSKKLNLSAKMQFNLFSDWEEFFIISREITPQDLIVLVSARKNSISHFNILDHLPAKIEKHFAENNRIVIYPQQIASTFNEGYDNVSSEPLTKGIESIQKIGKGLGNIFKK
jgi:Kef-type K+ transport system membrane component KefB